MSRSELSPEPEKPKSGVAAVLPLVFVAVLFAGLYVALHSGDPSRLPSVLVGKTAPSFDLPAIPRLLGDYGPVPGLSSAIFRGGEVSLLNVWASWCAPCQAEQAELIALSKRGIPVYGINYKDTPEKAKRFLARFGNPFRAIGSDESGLTAIDFGVYGVPETFVIDGHGRILYRHAGPLTADVIDAKLMPIVEQAREAARRTARVSLTR